MDFNDPLLALKIFSKVAIHFPNLGPVPIILRSSFARAERGAPGAQEALLLSVLHDVVETLARTLPESPGMGRPRDELRTHLLGALRSFRENPNLATVLQELRLRSRRDPVARKAFRTLRAQWHRSVAGILRRGIDCSVVRPDVSPEAGAVAITSLIMGLTIQLWVDPKACDVAAMSKELDHWLAPTYVEK